MLSSILNTVPDAPDIINSLKLNSDFGNKIEKRCFLGLSDEILIYYNIICVNHLYKLVSGSRVS